jgi:hypothetical protein
VGTTGPDPVGALVHSPEKGPFRASFPPKNLPYDMRGDPAEIELSSRGTGGRRNACACPAEGFVPAYKTRPATEGEETTTGTMKLTWGGNMLFLPRNSLRQRPPETESKAFAQPTCTR